VKPLDSYEAHQLERARLRYAQGKKSELLYWLHYCVMNNREIPAWIKEGLFKALEAAHSYKIRSWNEVFGPPVPKGRRLKTARRNQEIAFNVFGRVQALHKAGQPIGEILFEEVGKEFGIKKTLASQLYYECAEEIWPAPGSEDTELGVLMEPEVGHGETEVYPRVQA
jgi:hypothetical protein